MDNGIVLTLEKKSQSTGVRCGRWSVISECESGHHHAKSLYCGKEWCSVCGIHGSKAHNRRIARVIPKAIQIKTMGYFVIEFPDAYRKIGAAGLTPDEITGAAWCYSKRDLIDTTNRIVDILAGKRNKTKRRNNGYFERGLLRWHWFGDKIPGKYNPHVNVLVDGAYIENDKLNEIKKALQNELVCPDLIVNYHYYDQPGQMYQKVEYITRPTFTDYKWSPYMANELYNFRNQRWWGKWTSAPAWSIKDGKDYSINEIMAVSKLQKNICPECGKPLKTLGYNFRTGRPVKWTRPIDSIYLMLWSATEIAVTGYYRLDKSNLTTDDIIYLSGRNNGMEGLNHGRKRARKNKQAGASGDECRRGAGQS